jgi:hypothetical protein
MSIYSMVPMSGVALQRLQDNLPPCYSKEYDDCLHDPNSHPGTKCQTWYDIDQGITKEEYDEYGKTLDKIPYCDPGYSLPVVAIAACAGLVIGFLL